MIRAMHRPTLDPLSETRAALAGLLLTLSLGAGIPPALAVPAQDADHKSRLAGPDRPAIPRAADVANHESPRVAWSADLDAYLPYRRDRRSSFTKWPPLACDSIADCGRTRWFSLHV